MTTIDVEQVCLDATGRTILLPGQFVGAVKIEEAQPIGAGAVVRDSIIGANVWIGDEAVVEGAVLANGARVKRGARLGPGVRLEPDEIAG